MLPGLQARHQHPVLDPTPFVLLTGSLAVGVLGLLVLSGRPAEAAPSRAVVALVLAATMAAADRLLLALLRDGEGPGFDFDELFLVTMALLLDPATGAAAFAVGVAGNHLTRRMPLTKRLFNASQLVVAGSAAFAVMAWLDPTVREGPAHVLAVVMGAGVFFVVNQGLVARVVELVTGSPYWACLVSDLAPAILLWGANVSIGVLVGLVALNTPWIAPLAAVPVALLHVTSRAHERARADREQLRGLLRAAVHTAAADTAETAEAALTASARDLLGCARSQVRSEPPQAGELGVAFPGSPPRWLVAGGRDSFTAGSREVLGALVAIGSGTLARVAVVDQLRRQAATDALTGLPNEECLLERLEAAAATARVARRAAALVRVDLDDFRKVNESKGRSAGNQLLRLVGERLAGVTPRGALLARLGGDSFAIVVPPAVHPAAETVAPEALAAAALEALGRPFVLDDTEVVLTASAGIAVLPEHATDAAGLMQDAEVALHRAKAAGGGGSVAFLPWMRADARTRLTREAELRRAIDDGQLRVVYQPVVSLTTGEVDGAEALVRWDHPRLGTLGPGEFIAVAERSGMVLELDGLVLRQACRQARAWADVGNPLRVAVNLSGRHFREPGLAAGVLAVIDEVGVDPGLIELEVTESVAVDDSGIAVHELGRLRARGLSVAIDDFGTGYSMLARLQDFPVDRLKLDRSFVAAIDGTGRAPLVEAVVAMGRSLGLAVVAEGVETAVQRAVLTAMGCEHAQGWLFGRPAPPGDAGPGTAA